MVNPTLPPNFKQLTINVPGSVDIEGLEGVTISWQAFNTLKFIIGYDAKEESAQAADAVEAESPLACSRCRKYRAFRCSLCPEQVCRWCHQPDRDHHGGKTRGRAPSKTYIMTNVESGNLIPHDSDHDEDENSIYISQTLSGPCLSCGNEGHKERLLYRNPDSTDPPRKVAFNAICYACGAGSGNSEPVHIPEGGAINAQQPRLSWLEKNPHRIVNESEHPKAIIDRLKDPNWGFGIEATYAFEVFNVLNDLGFEITQGVLETDIWLLHEEAIPKACSVLLAVGAAKSSWHRSQWSEMLEYVEVAKGGIAELRDMAMPAE